MSTFDLSMDHYQSVAGSMAIYPGKGELAGVAYCVLGLVGEPGELANKLKKVYRDTGGVLLDEVRKSMLAESGDCLWYLSQIVAELQSSFSAVADLNLSKLAGRKQRGVLGGSGDER